MKVTNNPLRLLCKQQNTSIRLNNKLPKTRRNSTQFGQKPKKIQASSPDTRRSVLAVTSLCILHSYDHSPRSVSHMTAPGAGYWRSQDLSTGLHSPGPSGWCLAQDFSSSLTPGTDIGQWLPDGHQVDTEWGHWVPHKLRS